MLGLVGHEVHQSASGWSPVYVDDNLGVMSIGFMLPSKDDAIIWRGPRKNGLIKQFLTDVVWNELDYLIIDTPPGTSDEHISIVQYLKSANIDGAVVITTPQEVSMADVRKELNFCKKTGKENMPFLNVEHYLFSYFICFCIAGLRVLGVVENMSDIRIPFSSLADPLAGISLVTKEGQDVSQIMMQRYVKDLFDQFYLLIIYPVCDIRLCLFFLSKTAISLLLLFFANLFTESLRRVRN